MLFYDSANPAPNPRRVRIFLAEKGLRVPTAHVSIPAGEQRGEEYLKVNPLGQTPSLVLDDASVLTESIAICRYFEGLHPEPALFGVGAQDIRGVVHRGIGACGQSRSGRTAAPTSVGFDCQSTPGTSTYSSISLPSGSRM